MRRSVLLRRKDIAREYAKRLKNKGNKPDAKLVEGRSRPSKGLFQRKITEDEKVAQGPGERAYREIMVSNFLSKKRKITNIKTFLGLGLDRTATNTF